MNCASCLYWDVQHPYVTESSREDCRRHAPKVFKCYGERGQSNLMTEWPTTMALEWCGDYQAHPTRRLAE